MSSKMVPVPPFTAGGITTVNAGTGTILLDVPSNDFQSTVRLTSGGAAHVVDKNGLTLDC